jgi:single-strand DNA-binding protein
VASLNKVFLIGNLTRDPELRFIPSGTAVAKMGLAVNREYQDRQSGEKKSDVCFLDITVWGKQAELCNQYLSKGRPVFVEGRLEYSTWETKEGDKRSKVEVIAERVQFLGGRRDEEGGGTGPRREASRGAPASSDARSGARAAAPAGAAAGSRSAVKEGDPPQAADGPATAGTDDLNLDDIPF